MPLDNYNPKLKQNAQELRNCSTFAEKSLWKHVLSKKRTGFGFKRQRPIGNYIADFFCKDVKLVIELDGESHQHPDKFHNDIRRDNYLNSLGIKTVRISNTDVEKNLEGVSKFINSIISERAKEMGK